jgi:ABC-type Mn2+/Zn2+ transport system permease subunit
MRLVEEWDWIVRKAWSVKLIIIAGILSGIEVALGVLSAYQVQTPIPAGTFAVLSGLVSFAALIARFVAQSRD